MIVYFRLYLPFAQMLQVGDPEIVKASLYNHKAGYDVLMPLLKVRSISLTYNYKP